LQVPEKEKAALGSGHFRNNIDVLTTPLTSTPEPRTLQERRLSARFFLSAEIATTIARLHFGEARRA
jgi:hypothetical protein